MRASSRLVVSLLCLAVASPAASAAPPAHSAPAAPPAHGNASARHRGPHDATVRHRFDDPARWAKRFDDPSRDKWQRPDFLVDQLGLHAGQWLADIGAGTGYFNARWARAVGEDGAVFAVDIEPAMVAWMRDRAEREHTPQVVPVLGSSDNPRLPPHSFDWIVVVDTYHHIDARIDYFRHLLRSAKPGGRLVIVDFKPGRLPVGPPPGHKIAPDKVRAELAQAGWHFERAVDGLPYQYVLVFGAAPRKQ